MLVGLVQWYEDGYDLVGNLIEEIARGRAEKGWAEAISQFGQVEKGSWDVRDILRPCDLIPTARLAWFDPPESTKI